MTSEAQEEERIETQAGYRFKMRGKTIVAIEQTCPLCHEHYWQAVLRVGADPIPLGHSCQPERLGGTSVINKFG